MIKTVGLILRVRKRGIDLIVLRLLTRPVSSGGPRAVSASVADGFKNSLPSAGGVAPVLRLQYEGALCAIGNHEAVDHMMQLAAVTTTLIDVTHQLASLAAVLRVLQIQISRERED